MTTVEPIAGDQRWLRVERGDPSAEELAALVVVLSLPRRGTTGPTRPAPAIHPSIHLARYACPRSWKRWTPPIGRTRPS
jgi:hypothetical protein